MTGSKEGFGLAEKAVGIVENAGAKVEDMVGADHVVVKKTKKVWQYFLLYPAVFGVLLGAIPTGINIYKSFKYGIEVSAVAHAEEQKKLWIKNLHCVQSLSYHAVETESGSTVQFGACKNGDVLIEVIPKDKASSVAQWVSINRVQTSNALNSLLVSTAYAAQGGASSFKMAAATKTMCAKAGADGQTLIKILNAGGKCTRQIVKLIGGKIIKSDPVACNSKCTPTG